MDCHLEMLSNATRMLKDTFCVAFEALSYSENQVDQLIAIRRLKLLVST